MADPRTDPPLAGDERATLLGFLGWLRATLALKVDGLSAEQLAATHPPSEMTLGGMVKHLAFVENWWLVVTFLGERTEPWASVDWEADGDWEWHSAAGEAPEQVRALWEAEVARADEIVAAASGLDALSVRRNRAGEAFSLRWILVHLIEEYARHVGHADLIRESLDGSTGQ